MIGNAMALRMEQLAELREPFVLATVVWARRPTSVRPGDAALVLADGTIEGFVGGACAATSVRLHSLRAMETGDPLLLRLVPGDGENGDPGEAKDVAVIERNPCLSGGSLEIFLEPHLPAARLMIIGDSPIAHALARVGQAAGYDSRLAPVGAADSVDGAAAVVVSSHGSAEEGVLAAALKAGVPYVALVASSKRGTAVRSELPVSDELRALLHTPAGLAIGAKSPGEIAISILAQLVTQQTASPLAQPVAQQTASPPPQPSTPTAPAGVSEVTDPVCGMRVAVTDVTPQLRAGEESFYFCCEGCRDKYAGEHAEAVVAR